MVLCVGCFEKSPRAMAGDVMSTSTGALSDADTANPSMATGPGSESEGTTDASDSNPTLPNPTSDTGIGTDSGGGGGVSDSTGPALVDCESDPSACIAWHLPTGGESWAAYPADDQPHAPTEPAQAGFDIETFQLAYVLTASGFHVLDMTSAEWVQSGARTDLFPELGKNVVLRANAVPGYWAEAHGAEPGIVRLRIASATTEYVYDYNRNDDTFTFFEASLDFPRWNLDHINAVALADIDAAWADVSNGPGWVFEDVSLGCPDESGVVGPYLGIASSGMVFKKLSIPCFGFLPPQPFQEFAPFELPAAPPSDVVHAAAYNETSGLWIFR